MEALLGLAYLKKNSINTNETYVCSNGKCGKSFNHPLQLTILSSNPVETYPACPYCMSKIEIKEDKPKPVKHVFKSLEIDAMQQNEKKIEVADVGEVKCSHSFGYLKTRPKGSPIPDECLVCQKMIQCISR